MNDPIFHPHHAEGRKHMGGTFVLMGTLFLLASSGIRIFGYSPWILMVLVPFYWAGAAAYRAYRIEGRITGRVLLPLVFALLPFGFVAAGMAGVDFSGLWPVGMILAGLWFLASNR